ncbi:MAG: C4-dicarboxylate ABC transporter permease [Candidatus Marinimicrobia bacterium]|nr:C4-dicarboxylate ABC transporter permease [Candidatus Neomarinimicrobiota bacterium]
MISVLLISVFLFALIGMPIAFALGVGSMISIFFVSDLPLMIIPQRMFFGLNSWLLMSIPFFMLAGQLMIHGGMSKRLVDFTSELFGFIKGSLGYISITASMIFAGVSGSSSADTAAVGSIILPIMKDKGYNMKFATALQAAAGSIGPIIPPSLLMILIGYVTDTSVSQLFLGGIVPGFLIGLGLMVVVFFHVRKNDTIYTRINTEVSFKRLLLTGIYALPSLGLPLIIIFGIIGGVFSITESAVIAVVYGLIMGIIVYKEISIYDLPNILYESAQLSTIILFIQATAFLFSWIITVNEVPNMLSDLISNLISTPSGFYSIYILLMLFIGMFMESFSATVIFIPIVFPIAKELGIDPVHFGVVTTVGWAIGYITPPFGATLFVSCSISKLSIKEVTPFILPVLCTMIVVLLIITFIPGSILFLPNLLAQ